MGCSGPGQAFEGQSPRATPTPAWSASPPTPTDDPKLDSDCTIGVAAATSGMRRTPSATFHDMPSEAPANRMFAVESVLPEPVQKDNEIKHLRISAVAVVELTDHVIGRERRTPHHLRQLEVQAVAEVRRRLVAGVDDLAADQRRLGQEVEVEVVGPPVEAEGEPDGPGDGVGVESRPQHAHVVGRRAVLDRREHHSLAHGLDQPVRAVVVRSRPLLERPRVRLPHLGHARLAELRPGLLGCAEVEGGVGPEPGQPDVGQEPVPPLHEDVPRAQAPPQRLDPGR